MFVKFKVSEILCVKCVRNKLYLSDLLEERARGNIYVSYFYNSFPGFPFISNGARYIYFIFLSRTLKILLVIYWANIYVFSRG